ncbi:unnamed protein product [Arctia plantaginis]|uniref:Choline transporter-like protein n=1 Tax=Arctia plantaginis TaxID=874455 RepID=A0A8S1AZS3_ARCPL|nr:unnamed protein product [Arctia plantaginis]CAB3255478.1 unnamed protein product [Arctia plantaginis]
MVCGGCCTAPEDGAEVPQYDPDFEGPRRDRSCTDVFWLILFIIFLGVWAFVGIYAIINGDVERLLAPVDSRGRRCGLDAGLEDKRHLVFFNIEKCLSPSIPIKGCPTPQVCVKECPRKTIDFRQMTESNFNEYKQSMVCTEDINIPSMSLSQAKANIDANKCASVVLQSKSVVRRCLINVSAAGAAEFLRNVTNRLGMEEDEALEQVSELTGLNQLSSQIVHDLVESRWFFVVALILIVILCLMYILLLRWVVCPVVWVSLVGLLAVLAFCIYLCYNNYVYYKNHISMHQTTNLNGYTQSIFSDSTTWLVLLVIVAIILLILLLIIIFLRTRINIAIELIREGSKAVTAIKSTVLLPIVPWFIQCFVVAYGALVLIHLWSIGENLFRIVLNNEQSCRCPSNFQFQDGMRCNPAEFLGQLLLCSDSVTGGQCEEITCHFTGLDSPTSVVWLHLINLLVFFWTMFFISGISDMILASTFSTWYWTKRDLPFFTLTAGIYRTLRYHPGTVALGSLIIAIVRLIRVILDYIDRKLKKFSNPVTSCIMCVCKCCCWCLEGCLRFINKNAYIMCAIHGHSFCKSARDAFSLLMRNIARTVVLDKVTDFIFFLSKLLLSIGVGISVYYLFESNFLQQHTNIQTLYYNYVPAILLGMATYVICTIFFKVYEMAVDTLFLCFLEDSERNDGSPERPYFMSKNLMRILGKKNKNVD